MKNSIQVFLVVAAIAFFPCLAEEIKNAPDWRSMKAGDLRRMATGFSNFKEVKMRLGKPNDMGHSAMGSTIRYKLTETRSLWFSGPLPNDLVTSGDEKRRVDAVYLIDLSKKGSASVLWSHYHSLEEDGRFRSDHVDMPLLDAIEQNEAS